VATTEFARPWLILCEGNGDVTFLDKLLLANGLNGDFQVISPNKGNGAFGAFLRTAHDAAATFRETVQHVILMVDNDDDPSKSFAEIQEQLRTAGGFPVPGAQRELAKGKGYPSIVVLMIPLDRPGNLETLCVEAAEQKWALTTKVAGFMQQTPAKDWGPSKQAKMQLQTIFASTCKYRPDCTLSSHWKHVPDEFHLPITDKAFNEIVDFLRNFGDFVK
jgi:hypothetical protein